MSKGEVRVLRRSKRFPQRRVAEEYIIEGEPGIHWRWADDDGN